MISHNFVSYHVVLNQVISAVDCCNGIYALNAEDGSNHWTKRACLYDMDILQHIPVIRKDTFINKNRYRVIPGRYLA